MNDMLLMTTGKILDLQPPEKEFSLHTEHVDIAGIKSTPDSIKSIELQTANVDMSVPAYMTESDTPVYFKVNEKVFFHQCLTLKSKYIIIINTLVS